MKRIAPILLIVSAYCKFDGDVRPTYIAPNGLTCYLCSAGTYFIKDCSFDREYAVCSSCPSGTFSTIYNRALYCQPCSNRCPNTNYETENQPEIKTTECTRTSDIKCECRSGLFREEGYRGMCRRFKECPVGYGVLAKGTGHSDTVCKRCEPGHTFSDTTSAKDPCRVCTKCDGRFIVRNECTPDHDTVCIPLMTTANNSFSPDDIEQPRENNTLIPNGKAQCRAGMNFVPNGVHQPSIEPVYVELSSCIPPGEFKMFFRNIRIAEDTITRVTIENPFKIKEQCYQLLMEWGRLKRRDVELSDVEWSMELCRLLKSDIDASEDLPNETKQNLFDVLDRRSDGFGQQLPRNGGTDH
ncbi:tumor necrosis factor receptor superfamily member 21-like isoform X3 [Dreissena polymorpha]|uniref:tumor necrosis factor receptor superfamily member 21-like isoform X3 n=1 Tax=Dreissena polymorpha TaxID=45954 RepID=UPI0022652BE2|nr:tumor necrosis factor receptor superfamily member 21-like isoform X3 [Dreissena polymorpha]